MSLFEEQLEIIREFDNGNYNTKLYKDFLNNSKNDKDYNRNFFMLLQLVKNKITSNIKTENIKNIFRLYLDLFIRNCENKIEEYSVENWTNFSKIYSITNIKTNICISVIRIMNDKNKLKNDNEIEIGIFEDMYNGRSLLSFNVNNIEILNNVDLDNFCISVCIYDYDAYNKINSIMNTYIENENVKELKNILLNDDLNKFIEFIDKNKIMPIDSKLMEGMASIFKNYQCSIRYHCVLFSAVKCFMYLFANGYITYYEKLVRALAISGNVSIFKLICKYLTEDDLNCLINDIAIYHNNNLFEYILNNHYEDIIKKYCSNLYSLLINNHNFDMLLKLVNKVYINNGFHPNYKDCYIITYIYDNYDYCITKYINDVLYNILYEDITISEYKRLLYSLPTNTILSFDKLIFNCFKYNKSAEFIKELIKECEISKSNCYYFNEPLKLLYDLIKLNNIYKCNDEDDFEYTFIKDTFEKVFSAIEIYKTPRYYYFVKHIINRCFRRHFLIKDILDIVDYIKQGRNLKNREANKFKPVRMLQYFISFECYGIKPNFKKYEEIYLNNAKIPYDVDEMRLFISMFQNRLLTNDEREELLKVYKKYVNCLTFN